MTRLLLFFPLFFVAGTLFSQSVEMEFITNPSGVVRLKTRIYRIEAERESQLQQAIAALQSSGYLAAIIDSTNKIGSKETVWINAGPQYAWLNLRTGNSDEGVMRLQNLHRRYFSGKPLDPLVLKELFEGMLDHYEDNGYPFASVSLDSIQFIDSTLSAALKIDKGPFVSIDTIVVHGNSGVSQHYIQNLIGIRPGSPYNQNAFLKAADRLKEVPFLTVEKPPEIVFTRGSTRLDLFLAKRKASNFDGILGVLPDDNLPGTYLITGDIRFRLLNALNRGELIDLNFKKLQSQTQNLQAAFNYPFLFSTPLGVDIALNLYKKDTTFLNVQRRLAIQYNTGGYNHFRVFADLKSSSVLSTKHFPSLNAVPDYADVSTVIYGIGGHRENFDYRFNPLRGYSISFTAGAGKRTIRKHPLIRDTLYANLDLESIQYDVSAKAQKFLQLFSRGTIRLAADAAWLVSPSLFTNEMHRLGGFRNLRGFDEESIFASAYGLFTTEFRFLLERNSFAYVFWNGGYYEPRTSENFLSDTPYGFGAGMSFETKAGIFSISYALGSQQNNPIELRSGKVHFGILSFF